MNVAFSLMLASFDNKREQLYRTHCEPLWTREGIFPHIQHDKDKSGCWTTCYRAWMHLIENTHASHLVVLQDDFVPCKGFYPHLMGMIHDHPRDALTFFQVAGHGSAETKKINDSNLHSTFEVPQTGFIAWGGCLVLPRTIARHIIQLANDIQIGQIDDVRISMAMQILQHRGADFKLWCRQPGLVKHLGAKWESFQELPYGGNDIEDYIKFREGYHFQDDFQAM